MVMTSIHFGPTQYRGAYVIINREQHAKEAKHDRNDRGIDDMNERRVVDITESDFDKQVLEASGRIPVLVDFWAPWCGPCRILGPLLEKAVGERQGEVLLAKVNSDENPNLAARYGIQSIPTVLAFVNGNPANGFMGAIPDAAIRRFIDEILPKEADRIARQAAEQEKSGRHDEALERYRDGLRKDPRHPGSLIGQMRILIRLERWKEAEETYRKMPGPVQLDPDVQTLKTRLDFANARETDGSSISELRKRVQADPDDLESRDRLASLYAAGKQYREALDEWLAIVQRNRRFQDDGARRKMVQIFDLIDPRGPLAEEYREKLARVIYQ
jgi:putative thioredoxin